MNWRFWRHGDAEDAIPQSAPRVVDFQPFFRPASCRKCGCERPMAPTFVSAGSGYPLWQWIAEHIDWTCPDCGAVVKTQPKDARVSPIAV